MLVANPGQTPYSLHTKKSNCHGKTARNNAALVQHKSSSSSASTSSASALVMAKPVPLPPPPQCAATTTTSGPESNVMKTLSVRLNRGTEYIKETVQKAFLSKIPSQLSSVLSLYTVPPTSTHRFPERNTTNSVDSLDKEMCHFKPIRTAPTTPNKRSRSTVVKIPVASIAIKEKKDCGNENMRPKPSTGLLGNTFLAHSAFCFVARAKESLCIQSQQQSQQNRSVGRPRTKSKNNFQPQQKLQEEVSKKQTIKPNEHVKKQNVSKEKDAKQIHNITMRTRRSAKVVETAVFPIDPPNNIRITRKRQKSSTEETPLRKSVRLTKDCIEISKSTTRNQVKRASVNFSPPLTRSRLKRSIILRQDVKANLSQKY